MGKPRYKAADIIRALQRAAGNQSQAAKLLGCDRGTIAAAIKRWKSVREVYEEANETVLDAAEGRIVKSLNSDDEKLATDTAKWLLGTKGRARGYGKNVTLHFDPTALTDEQLDEIVRGDE